MESPPRLAAFRTHLAAVAVGMTPTRAIVKPTPTHNVWRACYATEVSLAVRASRAVARMISLTALWPLASAAAVGNLSK